MIKLCYLTWFGYLCLHVKCIIYVHVIGSASTVIVYSILIMLYTITGPLDLSGVEWIWVDAISVWVTRIGAYMYIKG